MPPRHAYWTILVDQQPTAFRAHDPEELLPTFNRLKERHALVEMKWFERGRLFDSREEARRSGAERGRSRRPSEAESPEAKPRDRTWRPGGDHRDPRQKYKDARKAKWQRFKQKIRARYEARAGKEPTPSKPITPPHGEALSPRPDRPSAPKERPRKERRGAPSRPHGDALKERPSRDARRKNEHRRTAATGRSTGGRSSRSGPAGSRDRQRAGAARKRPFRPGSGGGRPPARTASPKRRRDDEE